MFVRALIDYDNMRPFRTEHTRIDVHANANAIIQAVIAVLRSRGHNRGELHARLYGGWLTERGEYSPRAQWLLASLDALRGRRQAWRVIPEIALGVMPCPTVHLVGSFRVSDMGPQQKMIDTMLAVDMLHVAAVNGEQLVLVSDDDDLVPPSLASRMLTKDLVLVMRRRSPGSGLNDASCGTHGVAYATVPKDLRL